MLPTYILWVSVLILFPPQCCMGGSLRVIIMKVLKIKQIFVEVAQWFKPGQGKKKYVVQCLA